MKLIEIIPLGHLCRLFVLDMYEDGTVLYVIRGWLINGDLQFKYDDKSAEILDLLIKQLPTDLKIYVI